MTWNLFSLNKLPGAPALLIKPLPADGTWESNEVRTGRLLRLNQPFDEAALDSGVLRFTPDLNEEGSNACEADDQDQEAHLLAHSALQGHVAFERCDEPTQTLL